MAETFEKTYTEGEIEQKPVELEWGSSSQSSLQKRIYKSLLIKKKALLWILGILSGTTAALVATAYYYGKFEKVKNIYYPLWDQTTQGMAPIYYGQWETVIPDMNLSASFGQNLGMQTVHSAVLPSGKVLVASGSSWRNFKHRTQLFPYKKNPKSAVGLYDKQYYNFNDTTNTTGINSKLYQYFTLNNNVGIYDPKQNTFYRIPHPIPTIYNDSFQANDLFCTGHNHLPDGNVLFVGGTQLYYPYRTGSRSTYVFNWTKELEIDWSKLKNWNFKNWDQVKGNQTVDNTFNPWIDTGLIKKGRWYPSILPLIDHKMVVFGGYRDAKIPTYKYQMNKQIDIFDFDKFKNNPKQAWINFNLEATQNGPFKTQLAQFPPAANCSAEDHLNLDNTTFQRYCHDNKYDAFKLYPQNYLIKENQIFITQEGDWNSLRQTFQCCIRYTKRTYYMNLVRDPNNDVINITFEKACNNSDQCPQFYREQYVTMSGTSVQYRDFHHDGKKKIYVYGGMALKTGGTMLPGLLSTDQFNRTGSNQIFGIQYAGSRGSRKMERFDVDDKMWKNINETYLGATYQSDRTMHYSILLPTKQILIINGGNYDYFGPTLSPLLLTPLPKEARQGEIDFERVTLAPSRKGKLYHNVALLLRDGSVWTSGGNAARALVDKQAPIINEQIQTEGQYKFNMDKFDVDVFFKTDSTYSIGTNQSPAQSMYAQIFKPPYMFIDPTRKIDLSLQSYQKSRSDSKGSAYNNYYLIKSNKTYSLKVTFSQPLTKEQCQKQQQIVLIKLSSSTHGWNSGQSLISLGYQQMSNIQNRQHLYNINIPDAKKQLLPPGYYNLFYVDCKGKPGESLMVRLDDHTDSVY